MEKKFFLAMLVAGMLLSGNFVRGQVKKPEKKTPNPAKAAKTGKLLEIAVIPKGTTHIFWKSVHAGAVKASKELNVKIFWKGPVKESDREMQIQVVQNFISRDVDGIVLAPLDQNALIRPVRNAAKKGIKVVIIDSNLRSKDFVSFIATDNFNGGGICAQRLTKVMNNKGKALMMKYMEGSASTLNREKGFLKGMKVYGTKIKMIPTYQFAGATAEMAFKTGQNLLNKYKNIDGIFCPNESTTFGMLRALQTAGKAGKVKFVGFDTSDSLIKALEKGEIDGLAVQDPFKMGYLGVVTAVKAIQGKKVEKWIDTGVVMVTKENMKTPKIKNLIKPDLKKWLDE